MLFNKITEKSKELEFTTVRDWTGGLNIVDNDMNLNSRYQTVAQNVYLGDDGTLAMRPGTRLFANVEALVGKKIVNMRYFANHLICVATDGTVYRVNGKGESFNIFSNDQAAKLPGAPLGWDATNYVTFTEYNGNLIIANGINKPLRVYQSMFTEYLADDATGSNFFVPVARHVTTHGSFVIASGDPFNPDVLFISATGTIGVFEGAPPPNDGVNVVLGNKVTRGSNIIRGHASFRDKLIVFFDECIVIGTLGLYNASGDHVPDFSDVIDQFGAQNHNTIQGFGDDMLFVDPFGVPSLARAIFTSDITPDRASKLIDPGIGKHLSRLSEDALTRRTFSLYNKDQQQYMAFVPNDSVDESTSEMTCFVYRIQKNVKDRQWAEYRGWNWDCGCVSVGGRVFFAKDNLIFVMGDNNDPIFGDYNNHEDAWSDGTGFTDGHGWLITNLATYQATRTGVPIKFDGQTPWADFGKRMTTKFSKYIAMDTKGKARFTLDMFVDNVFIDTSQLGEPWSDTVLFTDDTGWLPFSNIPYLPALSMEFVCSEFGGYGASSFGLAYGDSRPTSYEQLYAWPAKCNLAKFRAYGYDRENFQLISLSVAYNSGSIRR